MQMREDHEDLKSPPCEKRRIPAPSEPRFVGAADAAEYERTQKKQLNLAAPLDLSAIALTRDSTNPKDSVGALKVSFGVCPQIARIYWALAMMDGANKYGEMNWREKKVRMSVYLDAIDRHVTSLRAGEDLDHDPVSGCVVPHSGRIMACCSIIEDARASGNLIDDRHFNDQAAAALKKLTRGSYTAASLALTRTPARTLDMERGGPQDMVAWWASIASGLDALGDFKKLKDAAERPLV